MQGVNDNCVIRFPWNEMFFLTSRNINATARGANPTVLSPLLLHTCNTDVGKAPGSTSLSLQSRRRRAGNIVGTLMEDDESLSTSLNSFGTGGVRLRRFAIRVGLALGARTGAALLYLTLGFPMPLERPAAFRKPQMQCGCGTLSGSIAFTGLGATWVCATLLAFLGSRL